MKTFSPRSTVLTSGLCAAVLMLLAALCAGLLSAQQEPPEGPPPDGMPGGPPPGGPGGGAHQNHYELKGVLTAGSGEKKAETGKKYTAAGKDLSAVYAHDGGSITLKTPVIESGADTSAQESSSFFGLNAAVLAANGGAVSILGGTITTTGEGANGAFASGRGSSVALARVRIRATGGGGHGVMTAGGGAISLSDVDIDTTGEHGAALATDRGGGTVTASGGTILTAGPGSPAIYSTGQIKVARAILRSTGSEGAVIEGSNSVEVNDSTLESGKLCGAMLYQSFSGDAEGRQSHFSMRGGLLKAAVGPAFYVTNTHGTIQLVGVKLEADSGVLLKAGSDRWGRRGQNGGYATLIAVGQTLQGNLLVADATSSIEAQLREASLLVGGVQGASLNLDGSSTWDVSEDSHVAALTVAGGIAGLARIHGNGHTVTYNAADSGNGWLGGKSYPLAGGGELRPAAH